jgi:peptidoglycan/xylan/chitin deacetylase (PgdA/CDA1 family)
MTVQRILDVTPESSARTPAPSIGSIVSVETRHRMAALTFDDGPDPEFTPRLLDVLDKHRAKATFFMVGKAARQYPEVVARAVRAGHAIGNHSWDHPSFRTIDSDERRKQIRDCATTLAPHEQLLFRPPYKQLTEESRRDVVGLGYQIVLWSVHAEDWIENDTNRMYAHLRRHITPGSVILLHDGLWPPCDERATDRGPMIRAVDLLLQELAGQLRFVTVPELLRHGNPSFR